MMKRKNMNFSEKFQNPVKIGDTLSLKLTDDYELKAIIVEDDSNGQESVVVRLFDRDKEIDQLSCWHTIGNFSIDRADWCNDLAQQSLENAFESLVYAYKQLQNS